MGEWTKHPQNPVLGPGYCLKALFDCCVIPEGDFDEDCDVDRSDLFILAPRPLVWRSSKTRRAATHSGLI